MPLWAIVGVGRTNVCTNESSMPGGNVICFSAVSMQRLSGVSAASSTLAETCPALSTLTRTDKRSRLMLALSAQR